jgi:cell shape-determining protein MreC
LESLARILEAILKVLSHWFAYDYGATKKENQQLKENEKLREKYEDIDDMDISANDVYAKWLRDK